MFVSYVNNSLTSCSRFNCYIVYPKKPSVSPSSNLYDRSRMIVFNRCTLYAKVEYSQPLHSCNMVGARHCKRVRDKKMMKNVKTCYMMQSNRCIKINDGLALFNYGSIMDYELSLGT